MGSRVSGISPAAIAALESHPLPGNVRELRNTIERALIFASGSELKVADLSIAAGPSRAPEVRDRIVRPLAEVEREAIADALAITSRNKTKAASLLGIDRKTLYAKIERHGL